MLNFVISLVFRPKRISCVPSDPISNRITIYCNDLMWRERRTTSATFPGSISAKLPTNTCVQVVARDTWFHIPEKFLLRGQISQKPSFFLFVLSLRIMGNVLRCLHSFHPLVDIPQIYLTWVTFAEGCTVFQLSTSDSHPLPQFQRWWYRDAYHFFKPTRQVPRMGSPRMGSPFAVVTNPLHIFYLPVLLLLLL